MNKELIKKVVKSGGWYLAGDRKMNCIDSSVAQEVISICADEAIDAVNFDFKLPEMAAITVENSRIHDLYRTLAIDAIEKSMKL